MHELGRDRRWHTRAHGRQGVVHQQGVGDLRAVVSSEPDLVHAVVEADDAVFGHDGPDVANEALRNDRKLLAPGALVEMREDLSCLLYTSDAADEEDSVD